jgi:ribosome biogenesis GTPase
LEPKEFGWDVYAPGCVAHPSYGRVALPLREHFFIWTQNGEVEATMSGRLRHQTLDWPCVGDWVALDEGNLISEILPRRSKLSRRDPRKGVSEQVLAANVDVLLIVSGLDHDYNQRRLERYIVMANETGARPLIVLNKADLRSDVEDVVRRNQNITSDVRVIAVSALTGCGVEALSRELKPGETAALIGSSGSGKSTLANSLLHAKRQLTRDVRLIDSKGRHTTTHRELILMPEKWLLMDLPGLRKVGLWAGPHQVNESFSDIDELGRSCRFRDCRHESEPGCAVRESGIDAQRLISYHKLKREAAYLERERDVHLARETKKKWRAIEKDIRRNHPKRTG